MVFDKKNKFYEPLAQLIRKVTENTEINCIRNKTGLTTERTDIKKVIGK